ncbi:MAG: site-specific integrase [Mucilaginibacter sp.]|nr:site-specific integrase [Mucilaginibacter sp.]
MATFSAKILKHQRREDGTYNVKIIVCHKKKRKHLDTEHFVSDRMLKKGKSGLRIDDPIVNNQLNLKLDEYRRKVSALGERLFRFDVDMLCEHLTSAMEGIDFLKFCRQHVAALRGNAQGKSGSNYATVANSLEDFFGRPSVLIGEITVVMLKAYERYLRSPRTMLRNNGHGGCTTIRSKGLGDSSVHDYLRDLSGFFTAAMQHFNKPSLAVAPITYNPFSEYKIVEPPETRKRNLKIEQIRKIRDSKPRSCSRAEVARDFFMLSFYLCGINAKDLYASNYRVADGRIEYNRSKTKGKRKDGAFISIQIPPEASDLLIKSKRICRKYASITNLNKALGKGFAELRRLTGISDFSFYWARHSFGNIARNKCRKSKDDVALALNHVDQGRRTTDIYLERDWTIVDEVQEAVMNELRELDQLEFPPQRQIGADVFSSFLADIKLIPLVKEEREAWHPRKRECDSGEA